MIFLGGVTGSVVSRLTELRCEGKLCSLKLVTLKTQGGLQPVDWHVCNTESNSHFMREKKSKVAGGFLPLLSIC